MRRLCDDISLEREPIRNGGKDFASAPRRPIALTAKFGEVPDAVSLSSCWHCPRLFGLCGSSSASSVLYPSRRFPDTPLAERDPLCRRSSVKMSQYNMSADPEKNGMNVVSEKSADAGVVVRGVDSPEGTVHRECLRVFKSRVVG